MTTHATFRRYLAQHKLMATRCTQCHSLHLPPRLICPQCHGTDLAWEALSGAGTLLALTAVYIVPTAMAEQGYGRDRPYLSGIVQTAEGPNISARILGADAHQPAKIPLGSAVTIDFIDHENDPASTELAFRLPDKGTGR